MLKIKNTLSLAAIVCGLLICFSAPASAQSVPPGSYQINCQNIRTNGGYLEATCQPTNKVSSIKDYFECVEGDIANNAGTLVCKKNMYSPLMRSANDSLYGAYLNVVGSPLGMTPNASEQKAIFLRQLFQEGKAPQFYSGTLGSLDDFLRNWLARPENASLKAQTIERAFKYVYDYGAGPNDFASYNAQKVGYADVVNAETTKLNSKPFVRRVMIVAAYKKSMGRAPTAADFDRWAPNRNVFQQIVGSNRSYLYSIAGAKDLAETVKRALANQMAGEPTSDQIKSAIVAYSKTYSIFDEMVPRAPAIRRRP